ncbi:MAG: HlyD family efflux transporter periplasmic adaptor subunit [Candidatus Pacebacteria bacterium]|nr:HlyD family efflux transporter periplasmic adaptor subunit [Candidatus Paceibacterota bacterium]
MRFIKKITVYILALPRLYSIGGAVIIIAAGAIGVHYLLRPSATDSAPLQIPHVKLESVATLSSQAGPLPVIGKVTSLNQATILAQSSGEITSLSKAIGDRVGAGEVIAEFANASEQAAVQQAQGAYDAAVASLQNAQGATAANSSLNSSQAASAAVNEESSAIASLQSAYSSLDDAVHTKADQLFSNPRSTTQQPTLLFSIPDSQLAVNLQNERFSLTGTLSDAISQTSASTSIDARFDAMTADAKIVSSFLNDCVQAANEAIPSQTISASTIAADQSAVGAGRSEVVAALAAIASAKNSYDAAQTTSQTAANSAGAGTQNSIAQAQAQVQEALGALNAAKANLEKTIVRSPISGTIVSLPVTRGDFVSSFAQVAQVSNPGALEIDTFVTPDDAKTLAVGGKATIEGGAQGVVTSIAPAIDPTTGEIEVKVGITSGQNTLTDGDTVTLDLSRAEQAQQQNQTASSSAITIPIVAAKITPTGPVVFTVSSSTLVAKPIVFGSILGDQVQVTSGLTPDMDIVSDARGLSDGETIVVDSQ